MQLNNHLSRFLKVFKMHTRVKQNEKHKTKLILFSPIKDITMAKELV